MLDICRDEIELHLSSAQAIHHEGIFHTLVPDIDLFTHREVLVVQDSYN